MDEEIEELYLKYRNNIYNYIYQLSHNKSASEELTQDTFLKVFKYFNGYDGRSSVKTWLYKIARNTFLDYVRKSHINKEETTLEYDIADTLDDYNTSDEKIVINKILSSLTETEKTLILLKDFHGFSYSEISSINGLNTGQVKTGIYRARKKFKELYESECGVRKK